MTKIEWCNETWNPVTGCTPISEGCEHCYAKRMSNRLRGRFGYSKDGPFKVTFHRERLSQPDRWRKPRRIFCCSMGDLFHVYVLDNWICKIINQIYYSPHTFIILTKRPKRMAKFFSEYDAHDWARFPNLWLGVTAETQRRAVERIPILLQIPAAKRFVSIEPMLGPVELRLLKPTPYSGLNALIKGVKTPGLDWVICGAETGPGARPMNPDWARSVRDQCQEAGVPFFMKQMSNKEPIPDDLMIKEFPK